MRLKRLVEIVGDEPVFETSLLLAGDVDPADLRKQLSRWTSSGLLYQLRRGLYALAPPLQKIKPHPFLVANHLVRASYVSGQSALAHYALIPEHVPAVTSVTTARPGRWDTPLGRYESRHVRPDLFFGYQQLALSQGQRAYVATPEKALLDLIYLQAGGDSLSYLNELRLRNLDRLNPEELARHAKRTGSPKLGRGAARVIDMARAEAAEYRTL